MSKRANHCTFCATGGADTRDHMPPRCFFPANLPSSPQPITVPCCRTCHLESQRTDGTIRNILISVEDTESAPVIRTHLAHKRDKSFSVDRKELPRLMSMMRQVDRVSPGGIFLKKDLAFNLDTPLMTSFVQRMCRGLLKAKFGMEYFDAEIDWRLNIPLEDIIYQGMAKFGKMGVIHDVFAYQVTQPKGDEPGWAILNFYRRFEIFARILHRVAPNS